MLVFFQRWHAYHVCLCVQADVFRPQWLNTSVINAHVTEEPPFSMAIFTVSQCGKNAHLRASASHIRRSGRRTAHISVDCKQYHDSCVTYLFIAQVKHVTPLKMAVTEMDNGQAKPFVVVFTRSCALLSSFVRRIL